MGTGKRGIAKSAVSTKRRRCLGTVNVELISITPNAEELCARAYGICTKKNVPVENIPQWVKMGHLTPVEHASASFLIEGISRSCLAQLTRHRLTSFSVESLRYTKPSINSYVIPQSIEDGMREDGISTCGTYRGVVSVLWKIYEDMVKEGIPKEDARMILPLATHTRLLMTANFRQLRHMIKLRTDKGAQWEIQELMGKVRDILIEQAPFVFGDLYD